jgi:hypothetical protein
MLFCLVRTPVSTLTSTEKRQLRHRLGGIVRKKKLIYTEVITIDIKVKTLQKKEKYSPFKKGGGWGGHQTIS